MGNFDLEMMYQFVLNELEEFGHDEDEKLCGFAIDEGLLCLNTVECFEEFVADSREDGDESSEEDLRGWTGDYEYQGFADIRKSEGFDREALEAHRCMSDEAQKTSEYQTTMEKLVETLVERKAFDCLNRTEEFWAIVVGHVY